MDTQAFNLICESLAVIDEAKESLEEIQRQELDVVSSNLERFVQQHAADHLESLII